MADLTGHHLNTRIFSWTDQKELNHKKLAIWQVFYLPFSEPKYEFKLTSIHTYKLINYQMNKTPCNIFADKFLRVTTKSETRISR